MDVNSDTHNHVSVIKLMEINHCSNEADNDIDLNEYEAFPEVIQLNVGGCVHTTSLNTLLKYPQTMLSAMFSGRHQLLTDEHGRYFIDRNGQYFHHVLNFLRQDELPPLADCYRVYQEAQFYNIKPLVEELELLRPVAAEKQKSNFLAHVPRYHERLHMLLVQAQNQANLHPDRVAKLRVCVYKEEAGPSTFEHINLQPRLPAAAHQHSSSEWDSRNRKDKHVCDVHVTFGPWTATPDVFDLIACIKLDLREKGYELEHECIGVCDRHVVGQYFCKRPVFEFKFKWW